MFTPDDFRAQVPRLLQKSLVACRYWEFGHTDLGGEESLRIARADKTAFESSLHFFINTLRFVDANTYIYEVDEPTNPDSEIFDRYIHAADFVTSSRKNFYGLVEHYASTMKHPGFLPSQSEEELNPFVAALNIEFAFEQCVIAEFQQDYAALLWTTSA